MYSEIACMPRFAGCVAMLDPALDAVQIRDSRVIQHRWQCLQAS